MREIKFRAWDKLKKQMCIYLPAIHNRNALSIEPDHAKRFEVMQFTGLKDKNGKEIYEGDIVRWKDPYGANQKYIQKVIFSEGCFKVSHFDDPLFEAMKMSQGGGSTDIEVIGNIYKNLELLEDKSHA